MPPSPAFSSQINKLSAHTAESVTTAAGCSTEQTLKWSLVQAGKLFSFMLRVS